MNWLDSLKPGDNVILNSGFNDKCVVSVKRIIKTQIVIGRKSFINNETYEEKFNKSTGMLVGGHGYRIPFISEATPEKIAKIKTNNEKRRIINKISDFNFKKVGLEYLFMIEDILKQVDNNE